MTIISVLNQKGGAGKTTASTNIAVELTRRGYSVLIIDTDEQRSASNWRSLRETDDIPVVGILKAPALLGDVKTHAQSFDVVIIDGFPGVSPMTAASVKVSDAVLIPVQPSPIDIWGTKDLVDLIKTRHIVSDGVPKVGFVVSRATKGTRLSKGIDGKLLEFELDVFDTHIHDLESYKWVTMGGQGVVEVVPKSMAALEIMSLVDEMIENGFVEKK